MVAWALTVREDFRNSLRSEWDSINADRDASKKEIEKLLKRLESKESELNRLQIQLGSLGSQLIVAKAEAEEARVQLHAEQAVKNTVKRATA
jgi:cell division septum initiation protein DivIVA